MTTTTIELVALTEGVDPTEVEDWVMRCWVVPQGDAEDWQFTEIDVARVRLIRDLRHDLRLDPEAIPVVLSLLDQIHALRRQFRSIATAIDGLPPDLRDHLRERLLGNKG